MGLFGKSTTAAMIAVGLLAAALPAGAAKPCRSLCRDEIKACTSAARSSFACTGLKGAEHRRCTRDRVRAIRACKASKGPILHACKVSANQSACSPSGAFLDADAS